MDRNQLLNDVEAAMRIMLDGRQSGIWTSMPGIITKVDYDQYTCEVQPAIQGTVTLEDGSTKSVDLPLLVDVPIVFPKAGGFVISFPIVVGNEVLVHFSSRCIDAWWQSGGIQRPMEARMHDLSDGFAVPGPFSKANLPDRFSDSAFQIRKLDSSGIIEISADGTIRLLSSSVRITGDIIVTGSIEVSGEVTANGIPLSTHLHPVIVPSTPFTGDTGVPTP